MVDVSTLTDAELEEIAVACKEADPRNTIGSVLKALDVGLEVDLELSRRQREYLIASANRSCFERNFEAGLF